MDTLFVIFAGIAFVFWGGYRCAERFPLLGSLLAVMLLLGAWFLVRPDVRASSIGDGAPSGAGAFLGLLWLLEAAGILLAGTLLLAGWRRHDHPLSVALFFFLFLPFVTYAIYMAMPSPSSSPQTSPMSNSANIGQQGTKKDAYVWAIDSQFLVESECTNGSLEFVAGCKEGVAKNRARHAE